MGVDSGRQGFQFLRQFLVLSLEAIRVARLELAEIE